MNTRTPVMISFSRALPLALFAGVGLWALVSLGCQSPRATMPMSPRQRPEAESFLSMPHHGYGELPTLLSQTGTFSDTASMTPSPALLPYNVISPLWSDGAQKLRWLAVPHSVTSSEDSATISFTPNGEWYFPSGTVAVKHFSLPIDERDPTRVRRLETRILVRSLNGLVYGATYRWRDDQLDAELLRDERAEDITITNRDGSTRTQTWTYPSPAQCLICHHHTAGDILGINTRQLNRAGDDGVNQLTTWNDLGLFDPPIAPAEFENLPRLVSPDAASAPLADRARSYLDANCSHCHRPGALPFVSYDARFETPLERQNLLNVRPVIDYGIDRVRYLKPNDPWRSMVLVRLLRSDTMKMPPIGRNVVDVHGVKLMRDWITSMEGRTALEPPTVHVSGDPAAGPVTLTVQHSDPAAELHYTLNGDLPDDESPRYFKPLIASAPATVRVKAIRNGFASSIAVLTTLSETPQPP